MATRKSRDSSVLGMPYGTAFNRLRKMVMFDLAVKCGLNICHRCSKEISSPEEFSIEHKEPWRDSENPLDMFYGMNNISFSHLSCNCSARRSARRKYASADEARAAHTIYTRLAYEPAVRRERYLRNGK